MKTWEENRSAINQLWPMVKFTDEEKRLWHDDLSGLDQEVLYDAIRNVKRGHDTLYPQLKWMLESYRDLFSSKSQALRPRAAKEPKLDISIDEHEDKRLAEDFVVVIDSSTPSDFGNVETMVLDKLPRMHARTALRVLSYARKRLLGQELLFGRVNDEGDVTPFQIGAGR